MRKFSSATSLLSLSAVADAADVTRQTIYTWLDAGVIEKPQFDVAGAPVFTPAERDDVVRVASERLRK